MVRSVAQRRVSNHEARAFPRGSSRARILRDALRAPQDEGLRAYDAVFTAGVGFDTA